MSRSNPLSGIRVVAIEQAVAAPLCTRHLADLGADVIKIERPVSGDFARGYDTVVHGESAYFVWLNHGKRSVVLDLQRHDDLAAAEALLSTADIFVHNLGPRAVERLGLGWTRIAPMYPRLIDCAISGYGQDGPYRDHKAFDLLLQGESGLLSVTGSEVAPAKVGISIADICAGMYALAGILAALHEREQSSRGRLLEISMLDCLAEWMTVPSLYQRYAGASPRRTGLHHSTIAPYGPYEMMGGEALLIAVQNEGQWRRLCTAVLLRPEMADDPRFLTNELRVEHRQELDAEIETVLARLAREDLIGRLDAADVPYGSMNSVADLLRHPQLVERGRWIEIDTPTGPAITVRSPLEWSQATAIDRREVPALGEHTAAVLEMIGGPQE